MFALSGIMYIGGLLGCLALLRTGENGRAWALIVLVATWATDVGAYLGGMAFGRHKMAPSISPGKSWEGAVSGVCLALIVGAVSSRYFGIPVWFRVASGLVLVSWPNWILWSRFSNVGLRQRLGKGTSGPRRCLRPLRQRCFTGAGGLILSVVRNHQGFMGLQTMAGYLRDGRLARDDQDSRLSYLLPGRLPR